MHLKMQKRQKSLLRSDSLSPSQIVNFVIRAQEWCIPHFGCEILFIPISLPNDIKNFKTAYFWHKTELQKPYIKAHQNQYCDINFSVIAPITH